MIDGSGIERLRASPGAEQLRQNTVTVQAAARADAAKKIAAQHAKPKAKRNAAKETTSARLTDDLKIVVVKRENPFTKGSEIYRRAEYVLKAHNKTVADAKRGRDGTIVRLMVDRGLIKVVSA